MMPINRNFHFISGPSLRALPDRNQRKRIRSQVIKRAIRDHRQISDQDDTDLDGASNPSYPIDTVVGAEYGQDEHTRALQLLGQVARDASSAVPFPSIDVAPSEHELEQNASFRYCIEELWPHFQPKGYAQQFGHHWIGRAHGNSAVMAAILFSSSMHRVARVAAMTRYQRLKQLRLKGEAVTNLRASLEAGLVDGGIDATIYTILCLATTPNEVDTPPADKNPFKAELFDLQWVSLYTRMSFDPTHTAAIVALVEKSGGIDKIREYSVAWLTFFACLMGAANSLGRPIFSPVNLNGDKVARSLQPLTGGFSIFDALSLPNNIVQTLSSVTRLSQSINTYLNEGQDGSRLMTILEEREMLIHDILSLPQSLENVFDPPPVSEWVLDLYSCARVGVLLFSLHVIFPIARTAEVRRQLLPGMPRILARLAGLQGSQAEQQLVLWSCLVTTIAVDAEGGHDSAWLFSHLGTCLREFGIRSTWQLKQLLSPFAWVDQMCDEAAGRVLQKCARLEVESSVE